MDPLSITASAITLIQAASAVSSTLCKLVTSFKSADAKVSALCHELSTLINFLETVDRTLKECHERPLSLASMDDNLWRQSSLSLEDCKATIAELDAFIKRIKAVAKSTRLFRRAKIAIDLTVYSRDIAAFQEKINKSNWALQTMLSAINVSFSLRSNVGQETILYELERLKLAIEQSLQVSLHHSEDLSHTLGDPSSVRVDHNLRTLARVAQSFYSNASSNASTIHGSNPTSPNMLSDTAISLQGGPGLTHDKKQQIDRYFKSMRRTGRRKPNTRAPVSPATRAPSPATSRAPSQPPAILSGEEESNTSEIGDDNDDGDDEAEYELLHLRALEEVAKDSMISHDFAKAETILEKVIQRRTGLSSGKSDFKKLQIQLAICYFFQHKWRLAEPLVTSIAKSKADLDRVVCNLLHALALAYLAEYSFDKSITICKQALRGKRRLKRAFGVAHETECNETLGLLATIYETKGDPMYAEALRRTMTRKVSYEHPLSELEFIAKHPNLSQDVLGDKVTLNWGPVLPVENKVAVIPEVRSTETQLTNEEKVENLHKRYERYREGKSPPQTLRAKLELKEKFNKDTDKEVVIVSVPSSASNSSENPVRTDTGYSSMTSSRQELTLKRSFTRRVARLLSNTQIAPQVTPDISATDSTPPSTFRRKFGKVFWSKSNSNAYDLKNLSRRRRRRNPEGHDSMEPGTVDDSFGATKWLGVTPNPLEYTIPPIVATYKPTLKPQNYEGYSLEEPSGAELGSCEVYELRDTSQVPELPSTGFIPLTTINNRDRRNNRLTSSWAFVSQNSAIHVPNVKIKEKPKSQLSFKLRNPSLDFIPLSSLQWLKKGFCSNIRLNLLSQKRSKARSGKKGNHGKIESWLGIGSGNYSYDGFLPIDIDAMSIDQFLICPSESGGDSESGTSNLPSTATESWNGTQAQKENLVVSPCTDSSQTDIIAKVLYDFQGEKSNELAVKENDMIQIVKRSDQGWLLGRKDGRLGFVPEAYVDTNLLVSNPVTTQKSTSLGQAPKRLSKREFLAIYDSKSKEVISKEEVNKNPRASCPRTAKFNWPCGGYKEELCHISEDPKPDLDPAKADDYRFSWRSNDSELFTSTTWNTNIAAASPYGKRRDVLPVLHYPGRSKGMEQKVAPRSVSSVSLTSSDFSQFTFHDDLSTECTTIDGSQNSPSPFECQVEMLLNSFSSLCLSNDPDKSTTLATSTTPDVASKQKCHKIKCKLPRMLHVWTGAG